MKREDSDEISIKLYDVMKRKRELRVAPLNSTYSV